jgi:flagellar biosynthesis protein FlhB
LIAKPKKAFKSIVFIIVLCFILLFAYAASSDELLNMPNYEGQDNTQGVIKWTGTGIIMMYILLGLAVISIVYYEISRFIKKSNK